MPNIEEHSSLPNGHAEPFISISFQGRPPVPRDKTMRGELWLRSNAEWLVKPTACATKTFPMLLFLRGISARPSLGGFHPKTASSASLHGSWHWLDSEVSCEIQWCSERAPWSHSSSSSTAWDLKRNAKSQAPSEMETLEVGRAAIGAFRSPPADPGSCWSARTAAPAKPEP